MSMGLPAAPNGGMNLRNAASRSGGIVIKDSLLSMQASDSSTPEPPAPVMMTTFSPFGAGRRASGLQHDDRLFLRHPLGDFGERTAVLQILAMLRDHLGIVVLLEE